MVVKYESLPPAHHSPPTSLRQCLSIQGIYITRVHYTSADHAKRVRTLLYCMGQDEEETLGSTNISAADREQYMTDF